jgi:hypothetical protein
MQENADGSIVGQIVQRFAAAAVLLASLASARAQLPLLGLAVGLGLKVLAAMAGMNMPPPGSSPGSAMQECDPNVACRSRRP